MDSDDKRKKRNEERTLNDVFTYCRRVGGYMQNHNAASYSDLAHSLDKRLFDRSTGHANKLAAYRDNLAEKYGEAVKTELGYLIEVRSDFGGLFITSSHGTRQLAAGECPLIEDMYDLLERAAKEVDWILLAFYSPLGSAIVDAAIIDCRHGLFRKSCEMQSLFRTVNLDPGRDAYYCKNRKPANVSASVDGKEIKISIENAKEELDPERLLKAAFRGATEALNLERLEEPFIATLSIQILYEMVRHESRKIHGTITEQTVQMLFCEIPAVKRLAYAKAFGERYGIEMSV